MYWHDLTTLDPKQLRIILNANNTITFNFFYLVFLLQDG